MSGQPDASNPRFHAAAVHDPLEGLNEQGMIRTGAQRAKIRAPFTQVVERAVGYVSAIEGNHSLYVYGSVATGQARVGLSDVDLVTVEMDPGASRAMSNELSATFEGICRGVEIGAAQTSDYEGQGDEPYGNRVFLRHYCVHLTGPDLAHGWQAFRADAAAARGFNGDIGLCLERWQEELWQVEEARVLARRVARKTLLALAGLVSVHDNTWTTDRVASAKRWAEIRPSSSASLDTLIAWSSGVVLVSQDELQAILDGVVSDVVQEFENLVGLWKPKVGKQP